MKSWRCLPTAKWPVSRPSRNRAPMALTTWRETVRPNRAHHVFSNRSLWNGRA